jgi:hypothetical protein
MKKLVRNGGVLWFCCMALLTAFARGQGPDRRSPEYDFFRARFEQVNGKDKENELNETFDTISSAVKELQESGRHVTLGGMLALVIFESGARVGFFNTRDAENSFNPKKSIPNVPKLDPAIVPFWQQALARYSYQLGILPVHTGNFRPCVAGTQQARNDFDKVARDGGFAPTADQLLAIQTEFDTVCRKALKPVKDRPKAIDYYVINVHKSFGVPTNSVGKDVEHSSRYPLYSPRVTVSFFFAGIRAAKPPLTDDRAGICAWGGGDKSYCNPATQDKVLKRWTDFSSKNSH